MVGLCICRWRLHEQMVNSALKRAGPSSMDRPLRQIPHRLCRADWRRMVDGATSWKQELGSQRTEEFRRRAFQEQRLVGAAAWTGLLFMEFCRIG
jgi:hypothetical protein